MSARCLYINFSRGWGGLEMFSANLFEWMSERGETVFFLVRRGTPLHRRLLQSGRPERVTAVDAFAYCDPRALLLIRRMVRRQSLAIVHTFKSSDVFLSVLATISFRKPLARRLHHLQLLPKHRRKDPLHSFVYRRLDGLLTITNQVAERAKALWPVRPSVVRTLYHGIDAGLYRAPGRSAAEVRRALQLPDGRPLLGIIGQVCEIKGQLLVLRAFERLRRKLPQAALVIAGSPPPGSEDYMREIRSFVAAHDLERAVKLLGFCENVSELLSALDLFVLGSRAEPFGLVVIEAMAAGVPVVASNAGGVPEIIEDKLNGLLYAAEDEDGLLQTLESACALDDAARARLIAAGQATIAERFSLARFIRDMSAIYAELQAGNT